MTPAETGSWIALAECRGMDPDLFFPSQGQSTNQAKQVCAACPVKQECLDHALANHERFGIFGGRSERERRRMRAGRTPALAITGAPPPDGRPPLRSVPDPVTPEPEPAPAPDPPVCPVCELPFVSVGVRGCCSAACDTRGFARKILGDPISDREYRLHTAAS